MTQALRSKSVSSGLGGLRGLVFAGARGMNNIDVQTSDSPETRMARSSFPVAVVVVCLGMCITVFSIFVRNHLRASFETMSAIWLTHDMLVAHVNQNNGDWPASWSDLDPYFTAINPRGYGLPDLAWVRDRVDIDFDFDPEALASSIAAQDRFASPIRTVDGTVNGEICNANERIRALVSSRRSASENWIGGSNFRD